MRFVWVTKEVPFNPDSGLLLYSNGLLRGLLGGGATGTLIAYKRERAIESVIAGLEVRTLPRVRRLRALSLFTKAHSDSFRFQSTEFVRMLEEALLEKPDLVVIDYFSMGWVLSVMESIFRHTRSRPVVVYIAHNFESTLRSQVAKSTRNPLMRLILQIDARKAAALERQLVAASDLVIAISDEDKKCFEQLSGGKLVITITPAFNGDMLPTRPINKDMPRRVVILGSFEWIAKQANLRRFLRYAHRPFTEARIDLTVVGKAPDNFVKELTARFPFCHFTGRVDDVRPFLEDARIGIMPDDVGGGFKLKLLDYIFAGVPIATIRSQFTGIPVDTEQDLIARDTMEELVAAVVESIDDIQRLNTMRQRCLTTCASAFKWDDRGRQLRAGIEMVMKERASRAASLSALKTP